MPLWREAPPVICQGFHLSGGEQVKIRVVSPNGSDYWVSGTINVIMGRKGEDDEASVVETIVVREAR